MGFTPLEQVGKGGMGVVWRARDDDTGQIVALKLLHDAFADDPEYRLRFEHELEIAKRINSQHVVKVLGYGAREGVPFIAFEFVEGPSLRELLAQHGPYGWPEVRAMLLQLAEGLADAHAAGVIHRDVKTSNVLIAPGGILKLADFGISRASDLTRVTKTSGLVGTPAYLAPEGPIDARSDLYALGVIAFELLTGSPPFEGTTYHEVLIAHMRQAPDISRLPQEARPVVAWLLAKDPDARPQTARLLVRVLTGAEPIPGLIPAAGVTPGSTPAFDSQVTVLAGAPPAGAPPAGAPLAGWTGVGATAGATSAVGATTATPAGTGPVSETVSRPTTGSGRRPSTALLAGIGAVVVIAVVGAAVMLSGGHSSVPSSSVAAPAGTPKPTAVILATHSPTNKSTSIVTASPSAKASVDPGGVWQNAGSLPAALWGDGAAVLPGGKVVVFAMVTGKSHAMTLQTSIVDPVAGAITNGPAMKATQAVPGVAALSDGSVFVAGGWGGSAGNDPVTAAELLDASTGQWIALAPMNSPRSQATVTELKDGRILVAGGWTTYSSGGWTATATAEVFDRTTGIWTATDNLATPRALATATRMPDGRVLMAGGSAVYLSGRARAAREQVTNSAELFDPASNGWQDAGVMSSPRSAHGAALLPDGGVLVVGGWANGLQNGLASADEYVGSGVWKRVADMPGGHSQARLVALKDGRLLDIAGNDAKGKTTSAVEMYYPDTGVWKRTGNLKQPVYWPAAVLLADGRVLVAGGGTDGAFSNLLEIYSPPSG